MYHRSILKTLFAILLLCCLVSCSGPKAAVGDTWNLVNLISKGDPITDIVSESIEVRNCIEPEAKTTDCSAGTSNNLSVSFGTSAEAGQFVYASIDSSISTELGIGRESGQSLALETPPPGYLYKYQIHKEFQIITGEVLARSQNGAEETAKYTFHASCSITIVEKEQVSCSKVEPEPTKPLPPTSETPDVPMIYILAGEFTMGRPIVSPKDEGQNEGPAHEVFLDSYYIDKFEVTNGDYKACEDAGVCNAPHNLNSYVLTNGYYSNPDYADFPVIHVDWFMAKEYCEWRGTRLPTEAEWEKAARGLSSEHFPWGQNISCALTRYATCGKDPLAVGSHPDGVSPYGVHDMAGNVWEWVADWYASDYYTLSSSDNPQGPTTGNYRVARGGGWNSNSTQLWVTYRNRFRPDHNTFNLGFRCAKSP